MKESEFIKGVKAQRAIADKLNELYKKDIKTCSYIDLTDQIMSLENGLQNLSFESATIPITEYLPKGNYVDGKFVQSHIQTDNNTYRITATCSYSKGKSKIGNGAKHDYVSINVNIAVWKNANIYESGYPSINKAKKVIKEIQARNK